MPMYYFELETLDGTVLRWTRLSKSRAQGMYHCTELYGPDSVKRYSWGES